MAAFDRVLAKYDWAKTHVDDFEAAVDDFRRSNPHTIGREDNVKTGQARFYVRQVPAIPNELAFMLGDVLHNLRSTLDHLAYSLVVAAGGKPNRCTSFPIGELAKDFKGLAKRNVPDLREACYNILDRIQPYKGGMGHQLWQLHKLDIVDKHRLLLTVSSVPVGRSMTPSERDGFRTRKTILGEYGFAARQMVSATANPISVPMQVGYELGSFPVFDVDENVGFEFYIAIYEPNIIEGMPTLLFLRGLASEIQAIINSFEPCLS
jgi:hypothetical protein